MVCRRELLFWEVMPLPSEASPSFSHYAAVEPYILERVRRWFYDAPFFVALRQGRLSPLHLRYFAVQYGHYSRQFPRVLGASIAAMEGDPAWWVPLADNLWDEAGRGVAARSHYCLYYTFLKSVGADLELSSFPLGRAVDRAVTTFLRFFRRARPLEAMAAVGLGSELFAGQVMQWILDGLSHPRYQIPTPLNLEFWRVHVLSDEPRHYALCRQVLEAHAAPADLPHLVAVGLAIARSEARMYTGIWREAGQLEHHAGDS